MTIGYAPGVFDLFHIGHLNALRHAKMHCDHLIAGVVSDDLAFKMKGRPPVVPIHERLSIVSSIRFVDEAIIENHESKTDTWQEHPFDVIFKGDDWKGTPKGDQLERDFARVGVEVIYFPYTVHTSSSKLRGALDAIEAQKPAQLLA